MSVTVKGFVAVISSRDRSISVPKASTSSSQVSRVYSEETTYLRRSARTKRDVCNLVLVESKLLVFCFIIHHGYIFNSYIKLQI